MSNRLENSKVALRYARALFDNVVESGELEAASQSLETLNEALSQVPAFYAFMENPAVSLQDKLDVLDKKLIKGSNPWVGRLLRILVENGRMAVFPQLVEHFVELMNQRENTTRAEVVTAVELEKELKTRIQRTLETTLGYSRVDMQHRVDPGILGGMIVKVRDRIIDGSYVGRLEELRKQLVKT